MALRRILQNPYEVHVRRQREHAVSGQGPKCLTCLRPVLSDVGGIELVEGEPGHTTYARVLIRHHGAEELHQFDFGSKEWDSQELRHKIDRHEWFDPHVQGETTGGRGS